VPIPFRNVHIGGSLKPRDQVVTVRAGVVVLWFIDNFCVGSVYGWGRPVLDGSARNCQHVIAGFKRQTPGAGKKFAHALWTGIVGSSGKAEIAELVA
jgi:hypothetical protein